MRSMLLNFWTLLRPELDIWCVGLTILTLLLQLKYPVGTSHKDLEVMARSVRDCLHEVDELYPMPTSEDDSPAAKDWRSFREGLEGFLVIDGLQRMRNFQDYRIGMDVKRSVQEFALAHDKRSCESSVYDMRGKKKAENICFTVKSVFFYPTEVKYTLPLHLQQPVGGSYITTAVLKNPERLPAKKVISYLKYLLRSAVSDWPLFTTNPN